MLMLGGADLGDLAPIIDEFRRWRTILGDEFNRRKLQIKG